MGSGGVALTFKTDLSQTQFDTGCGGYRWKGFWGLKGANAQHNGYVVQKITYTFEDYPCAGSQDKAVNLGVTYWEAWEVRGGTVVGAAGSASDTYKVNSSDGFYGLNSHHGYAKYMDGYTEPRTWTPIPESGSAPATRSQPPGWSDAGTLHRWISNEYNCCATDAKSGKSTNSGDGS